MPQQHVVIIANVDPEMLADIIDLVSGKTAATLASVLQQTQADAAKATAVLAQAEKPQV
jgi:hypothetical protein